MYYNFVRICETFRIMPEVAAYVGEVKDMRALTPREAPEKLGKHIASK